MNTTTPRLSTRQQLLGLLAAFALTFAAAAVGGVASASAGSFYQQLSRPDWAPPGWLFGPAWGFLYTAMAVAAWLAWRADAARFRQVALPLFVAQLAANALWTWLFFAWRQGAWAFAEVLLLWLLIAATATAFWRLRPLAGALLLPYLGWVAFASALTFATWQRNPLLLG